MEYAEKSQFCNEMDPNFKKIILSKELLTQTLQNLFPGQKHLQI